MISMQYLAISTTPLEAPLWYMKRPDNANSDTVTWTDRDI